MAIQVKISFQDLFRILNFSVFSSHYAVLSTERLSSFIKPGPNYTTMSKQRSNLSKGRNFNAKLVRHCCRFKAFLATKSNVASTLLLVWTGLKGEWSTCRLSPVFATVHTAMVCVLNRQRSPITAIKAAEFLLILLCYIWYDMVRPSLPIGLHNLHEPTSWQLHLPYRTKRRKR